MKKYRFNLEPVLNHRRLIEETLQKDLAILKISLIDENERLITYEDSRVNLLEELQQIQKEGTTTSDILLYLPFIEQVSKDIDGGRSYIQVQEISGEDRIRELATMLGGPSEKNLESARELLDYVSKVISQN